MRILVIDNYDSFTYNLVQYLGELQTPAHEIEVVRNDHATVEDLLVRGYDRVIVSPGPCTPNEAGISLEAVRRFPQAQIPTLGVCLGHQALVQAWGGSGHPPRAGARQDLDDRARRQDDLPRAAAGPRGRALPLADRRRPRSAGRARGQRHRRRRRDGRAPPRAARRGRPVPPGVGPHRARQGDAR